LKPAPKEDVSKFKGRRGKEKFLRTQTTPNVCGGPFPSPKMTFQKGGEKRRENLNPKPKGF